MTKITTPEAISTTSPTPTPKSNRRLIWLMIILSVIALTLAVLVAYLLLQKYDSTSTAIPASTKQQDNFRTQPATTSPYPKEAAASVPLGMGIGFGLGAKTLPYVSRLTSSKDFVDLMLSQGAAANITSQLPSSHPPIACIARSLDKIRETISIASSNNFKCDFIGYNPEQREGTPTDEMNNFVQSTQKASQLVHAAGLLLVTGPGLKYMIEHEDQYTPAAVFSDVWVIQSQGYEIDPKTGVGTTPEQYSVQIKRIAGLLRQGNPHIKIWVQIIITPGGSAHPQNLLSAEEVATLAKSLEGTADAVRIYQQGTENGEVILGQIIDILRPR